MGNKIARTTQLSASEYYLHDLPSSYNLVLKEVLGRGRFFKCIQCKHDEGLVLVKVYFKRGDFLNLKCEMEVGQILAYWGLSCCQNNAYWMTPKRPHVTEIMENGCESLLVGCYMH
eukprot:Gb_24424 [translate_table: standard]